MTVGLVGDTFLATSLASAADADVQGVRDELHCSDVVFANLETLFHSFEHPPMPESGGTFARTAPELVHELRWLGIDMLSVANNHAGDYGAGGLLTSLNHLHANGIATAGAGADLTTARQPAIFRHPHGSVALVAATSTFPPHIRAADGSGAIKSRAGINPLRYELIFRVSAAQVSTLDELNRQLGLKLQVIDEDHIRMFRTYRFPEGYEFMAGTPVGAETWAHELDLQALQCAVSEARSMADIVLASLHVHENLGGRPQDPPTFMRQAAHTLIEAGANAVIGHGPHVLRGIEMYRGSPIFYSLGNFIFQADVVAEQPPDAFEAFGLEQDAGLEPFHRARRRAGMTLQGRPECWRSVLVRIQWSGRDLKSIRVVPIDLAQSGEVIGVPRLARGVKGQDTLNELAGLSAKYGTTITVSDDSGSLSI